MAFFFSWNVFGISPLPRRLDPLPRHAIGGCGGFLKTMSPLGEEVEMVRRARGVRAGLRHVE